MYESVRLQNGSGNGHSRSNVDVVGQIYGWFGVEGQQWRPGGCMGCVECIYWEGGENMLEAGGLQRRMAASGFAAAVVDDGFVRAQPALDGIGWLLKKLGEGLWEEIARGGKDFVFKRVDSSKIAASLFSELVLLGCSVVAVLLFVA
jgi:hypothetical protein